jgi:membrane protease YdiL (CAAX protease family)
MLPDAVTIAVMRDLLTIAGIALLAGLVIYPVVRVRSGLPWNTDGNVLSRPYGWPEAVAALLLLAMFFPLGDPESYPIGEHSSPAGGGESSSATSLMGGMVFLLLIALVLLVFLKMRGLEPSELFGIRQMTPRATLVAGLAGFGVVYLAVTLFANFILPHLIDGRLPNDKLQAPVEMFQNARGMFDRLLVSFGAVIIAPVAEEIIVRGFLYGVTKRFTDRWFSAVFTSLVFACMHNHIASAAPLFVLAMGFAIAYEVTGSLLVPMIMHATFNGVQLVLLSLMPQP